MPSAESENTIRFYFSFRSPYSWLATERLDAELGDLNLPIDALPIYPPAEHSLSHLASMPEKVAYIAQDVRRLARHQGLTVGFPSLADPDWSLSHAAFLGAKHHEKARDFMLQLFRKRFTEGRDLGEDEVIAAAAREAGSGPEATVSAAHAANLREEASAGWRRGVERDGIFGVPSFIYAGKLYWGQDRMHFVRSAVIRKSSGRS